MPCFRVSNQLRMAIVVEKIEKIIKIGPEMAEIEHFHPYVDAYLSFVLLPSPLQTEKATHLWKRL